MDSDGAAKAERQEKHLAFDNQLRKLEGEVCRFADFIRRIKGDMDKEKEAKMASSSVPSISFSEFLQGGSARIADLKDRLHEYRTELESLIF